MVKKLMEKSAYWRGMGGGGGGLTSYGKGHEQFSYLFWNISLNQNKVYRALVCSKSFAIFFFACSSLPLAPFSM